MKWVKVASSIIVTSISLIILSSCSNSNTSRTLSPAGAKVFIIEPKDNAEVSSPVKIKFGIQGMEIIPAGTEKVSSGHHHLLIDTQLEDESSPIPANENYIHFGKGQTETSLDLKPGKHSLQLVLGDHNHIPHDPIVQSEVITIMVK